MYRYNSPSQASVVVDYLVSAFKRKLVNLRRKCSLIKLHLLHNEIKLNIVTVGAAVEKPVKTDSKAAYKT